jgi:O-antigen ligase
VPPRLLGLSTRGRSAIAVAGALCAWLLALSAALTANRTAVVLAGAALVVAVWLAPRRLELGPLALAVIASASASALVVGSRLGGAGAGRLLAAAAFAAVPCVIAAARPVGALRRSAWIALVAVAAVAATAASVAADRGSGCQADASHGRVGIWRAAVATASDRPLQGYGSGTFLAASRSEQLKRRPRPTRFAHNLPLEGWVELGLAGLAFVIAWYVAVGDLVVRGVRRSASAYLLVPAVAAFPLANLLDWPWHLLGAGVLWALAAGGLVALRR